MEFSKEHTNANIISAVEHDHVLVNDKKYSNAVIVTPDTIIEDWQPIDFKTISAKTVDFIASLKPELVILATGSEHQNLSARGLHYFFEKSLAPECMNTSAACRTYNVLVNEGRKVVLSIQF